MIVLRTTPGPCLFCRREAVEFTREHLPPESVAGVAAIELLGWVCGGCNNGFSSDEVYFASHYHGAEARAFQQIEAKRWRGARGARMAVPPEAIQRVVEATLHTTPPAATHWTIRTMAGAQGLSRMTAQRIWKQHGLQPHRVETFKLSRDPHFVEKFRDVVGLYLDPPDKALVLSVDEKSQIQAAGAGRALRNGVTACRGNRPGGTSVRARRPTSSG